MADEPTLDVAGYSPKSLARLFDEARHDGRRVAYAEAIDCCRAEFRDDGTAQRVLGRILDLCALATD